MGNQAIHNCGHVIRKKVKQGRTYEEVCGRSGAEPMFTVAVTAHRTRSQPRWFCSIHWPRHEEVMFDGVVVEKREFPGSVQHRTRLKDVS